MLPVEKMAIPVWEGAGRDRQESRAGYATKERREKRPSSSRNIILGKHFGSWHVVFCHARELRRDVRPAYRGHFTRFSKAIGVP